MRTLITLSFCFLLAACEISIQDSTMMELQGAGITTQEKSSLLDQALADLKGENFPFQVKAHATGTDSHHIKKIDAEKVIQGERVYIKCDVEADTSIKDKLVNACLDIVSTKLMSIVKDRKNT